MLAFSNDYYGFIFRATQSVEVFCAYLDARNSEKLMEMFTEINEKFKTTIVMVTHDPFSVSYCNHIFFLKNGKISYELYKGARGKEQYLAAILDAQNI